jgi:hypothetical protein
MDPPDVEALEAEATASRSYGASRSAAVRSTAPLVRGAISERSDDTRRAPAPARQQQQQQQQPQSVRLPPRRAQAFTARAPEPRAWAPREPVRPELAPALASTFAPPLASTFAPPVPRAPSRAPGFRSASGEDDTIIVQHPAIRSSDDRPRRRAEALPAADHDAPADEPRKKTARPKPLARGKHKVERVD